MKLRKSEIVVLAIVLVALGIGIYVYPMLPARVAAHWNAQGQADGYMSKFWGVFLMPIIAFGFFFLYLAIPYIDPKKENIEKFRGYFDAAIILIFLFLLYLYILTLFWNFGYQFNLVRFLAPAFGILFYAMGVLLTHARMNWSIGIRTPWTLSSEVVWQKTHKLGGKLMKISGLIALLGVVFPHYAIWLVLVPILAAAIFSVVYSYLEFRKEAAGH